MIRRIISALRAFFARFAGDDMPADDLSALNALLDSFIL